MLLALLYILHLNGFLHIDIKPLEETVGNVNPRDGNMSGSQVSAVTEDVLDINEFIRNLPKHLTLLPHQAGGHAFNHEMKTLGLLKDSRGYVLKPTEKKTINELNFYKEVQHGYHPKLAPLLPEFKGTVNVPFGNKNVEFMVLEDLARGFEKPCVLDLKIGKRTWGPNASPEKIKHEKEKYASVKEQYGFFIPGYLVTNPITNEVRKYDRQYCRSLTPETLIEEIENFVNTTENSMATAALLKRIIVHLEPILEWASTQTELRLYASSIIVAYDSQALLNLIPILNKENTPDAPLNFVRVKMVDFTHTHRAPLFEGVDTNYLYGVNSIMNVFQTILLKHSNSM